MANVYTVQVAHWTSTGNMVICPRHTTLQPMFPPKPFDLSRSSLSMEMSSLTRDGIAEPVSRDQILRHEPGQGKKHFPCSADHEQDWRPDPVD